MNPAMNQAQIGADGASPSRAGGGAASSTGLFSGYSPDDPKPLVEYAASTLVFSAALAAVLVAGRERLPEHVGAGDILLMGVASHKFSRILSKDKITAFVRAPFVRYEEDAGQGEVSESPRGTGMRRVIGELLICPYCLGQWVAAGYATSLLFAPRTTRYVASVFVGLTVSDFLQLAYRASKDNV